MKKILSILLLFMGIYLCRYAQTCDNDNAFVRYRSLAPLCVNGEQGVSAPFAGRCDDFLVVAGGCNFPNLSAAEGGRKVFYDKIFAYAAPFSPKDEWKMVGTLPKALAYGSSVTVPEGIVIIGGTDGLQSSSDVRLLQYDGDDVSFSSLPSLPVGLDNFGAAFGGGYIYVAGGSCNGEGRLSAFRLPYPDGTAWEILPEMPGRVRLQPACALQHGAEGYCFYVMGGFTPATEETTGIVHDDGVYFDAQAYQWKQTGDIKVDGECRALVGAAAIPCDSSQIIFFGGVNYDIFLDAINRPVERWRAERRGDMKRVKDIDTQVAAYMHHPESWYRFNDNLLIYHTTTDTWVTRSQSSLLARAGAAVIPFDNEWIIVDGESKPGIRSADVTAVGSSICTDFKSLHW